MNSGNNLRVSRTLELLAKLKETGSAFAAKEAQLSRDLGARRFAINRSLREAMAASEEELATRTATATAEFGTREQHATTIYESRQERIEKFRTTLLRELPLKAQRAKETWMGDLQMRDFHAQTKRTADLAAADADYSENIKKLARQRTTLASLEHRTRRAFFGYWSFQKMLRAEATESPDQPVDSSAILLEIANQVVAAEKELVAFRQFALPKAFSYVPIPALLLLVFLGCTIAYPSLGVGAIALGVVLAGLIFFLHLKGGSQSQTTAEALAEAISGARQFSALYEKSAQARYEAARQNIQRQYEQTHAELAKQWNRADSIEAEFEATTRAKLATKAPRAHAKNEAIFHRKIEQIATERTACLGAIQQEIRTHQQRLTETHDTAMAQWTADEKSCWAELQAGWQREIVPLYQAFDEMNVTSKTWFPPWTAQLVESWTPPTQFTPATEFGRLNSNLAAQPGQIPKDPRLALPSSPQISVPLALSFPMEGSLLFETNESGSDSIIGTINQVIFRLLTTTPPGKISFTILDPVSLGKNFSGLMQLADYEESLINRRIWTQRDQIEERLAELCEHIE